MLLKFTGVHGGLSEQLQYSSLIVHVGDGMKIGQHLKAQVLEELCAFVLSLDGDNG